MPGCRWFGAVPSALTLGRRFVARTLTGIVCLAAVTTGAPLRAAEPGGSAAALANDLGQAWAATWAAASAPDSGARRAADAEQRFYLVHVAIVTDNGRVNLDRWLPLPGVLGENTPQTGVSYTDAASGQTVRYGFHDFGSGGVICLKLSDTCEYIYDHTIYGYEFGAPATGVLSCWSGYDGMPGYYAILGWEDPPGMTVGTPGAGGRVPVALDYGSLDVGTLVFAPDPATAGVYLAATGGAPLTGTELQFAPAALPDTLYVEPAAAAATRLTARWTSACSECNLGQVTVNAGPQIVVRGQGQDIANGDLTPAVADDTDFGTAAVSGNPVTHTFTVANLGAADLTLDGTPPVLVAGAHPGDFTVTATPTSPVAPNGSVTFAVTFAPLAVGLRTALVSLATNDAGANPYAFAIQGNGSVAPAMSVSGGGVYIANGDVTPAVADDTDFGSLRVGGGDHAHTFTILNLGAADLHLTGTPRVTLSGPHPADFLVWVQPGSPVPAGGSTFCTIRFAPTGAGLRSATVAIANDDADENPYTFAIQGTGKKHHRTVVVESSSDSGCRLAGPGAADGALWLSLGVALLALGAARRRRWFTLGRGRRSA